MLEYRLEWAMSGLIRWEFAWWFRVGIGGLYTWSTSLHMVEGEGLVLRVEGFRV